MACAHAAREMQDVLGEAKALQHLGLGSADAADEAMVRAMGTIERALTPTHPVIADILLSRARMQSQAGNFPKVLTPFCLLKVAQCPSCKLLVLRPSC